MSFDNELSKINDTSMNHRSITLDQGEDIQGDGKEKGDPSDL